MSFDAGTIIGTIQADGDPWKAGLDQATADGEAWESRTYRASLDADRTNADASLDETDAKLDDFATKVATARTDIDTGDSDEKMAVEDAAVDAFGAKRATARVDVDSSGADRGLDDIKNRAADAAGSDGLGLLLTTALSLGPALVPIGAVAVAGLAAIAPMALAAGAGIGAFALAASGDLSKVETSLDGTLKSFQALAAPTVLPVINGSLGLIIPLFADLVPLVDSTSTELTHLETAASGALGSPFWQGFITFLAVQAPPAIDAFTSLLGGLGKAFAGISVAFGPVIADVEGGMDGFAARIASWGQGLATSNGLVSFINYVHTEGPVVGQLLTTLGGSVEHLLVGLAPIGAVVLAAVGALTKLLDIVTGINPALTTIMLTVAGGLYAWSKLAPLIDSAQGALLRFSTTAQGVEGVAGGSEGAIAGLVAEMGGLGVAVPVAAVAVGVLVGGFVLAEAASRRFNSAVSSLVGGLDQLPTKTLPDLSADIDDVRNRMQQLGTQAGLTGAQISTIEAGPAAAGWAELNRQLQNGIIPFSATIAAIGQLSQELRQLQADEQQQNDNLGFLQAQFGVSRQSALDLANSIGLNLNKALDPQQIDQFGAALTEVSAKAGLTTAALKEMASAGQVSASTLATNMTNAANATTTAWASLGNAVTQFSSTTLPPTAAAISQFYSESELQGAAFSQNIQAAIKAGYSPTLISSIVQAGPAQASQLLQGLVNAQGTGLQALISQATAAMSKEGAEAVEEARLTEVAVTAHSSTVAAALPTALAISQALTATNAAAQVQAVASSLSGGLPQLLQIAAEYGIALPNGLAAQVNAALLGGTTQAAAVAAGMRANQTDITSAAQAAANVMPAAIAGTNSATLNAAGEQVRQFVIAYNGGAGSMASAASAAATAAAQAAGSINWAAVGESADTGMASGITSQGGLVINSVQGVVAQVVSAARTGLKAASPSKVFIDIGATIPQGLAVGITSNAGLVVNALAGVLTGAKDVAAGSLNPGGPEQGAGLGWGPGTLGGINPGGPEQGTPPLPPAPPASPTPYVPYNPAADIATITGLAQSYANGRSVTLTSSPSLSISVPGGTSAEMLAQIESVVTKALDDNNTALLAELDAIG